MASGRRPWQGVGAGCAGWACEGVRVGRCLARGRSGRPGEIQLTESPVRPHILPRASLPPARPHLIAEVHYRATAACLASVWLECLPSRGSHSAQLWPRASHETFCPSVSLSEHRGHGSCFCGRTTLRHSVGRTWHMAQRGVLPPPGPGAQKESCPVTDLPLPRVPALPPTRALRI